MEPVTIKNHDLTFLSKKILVLAFPSMSKLSMSRKYGDGNEKYDVTQHFTKDVFTIKND